MELLKINETAGELPEMFGLSEERTEVLVWGMSEVIQAWVNEEMQAGQAIAAVAEIADTEEERAFLLLMVGQQMLIIFLRRQEEAEQEAEELAQTGRTKSGIIVDLQAAGSGRNDQVEAWRQEAGQIVTEAAARAGIILKPVDGRE